MDFKKGDLVTFPKGLYGDEEGTIYRIVEVNGDRCLVTLTTPQMTIPPQSVASISELEPLLVGE